MKKKTKKEVDEIITLDLSNDVDVLAKLNVAPNKSDYIKQLIREDIKKEEPEEPEEGVTAKEAIGYMDLKDIYLALNKTSERTIRESFETMDRIVKNIDYQRVHTLSKVPEYTAYVKGYYEAVKDLKWVLYKKVTREQNLNNRIKKFLEWYLRHYDEIYDLKKLNVINPPVQRNDYEPLWRNNNEQK